MDSNDKNPEDSPRLCLELTLARDGTAVPVLQAALADTSIAAVILSPAPGSRLEAKAAKPVVELIQSRNAAALLENDVDLVRELKADGVHIPWSVDVEDVFKSARDALGTNFIAGAEAGSSRHTAMCLGEAGADYVAFGSTETASTQPSRREMCAWWSDLVEVAGMATGVEDPDEAASLAGAGIDFISIKLGTATPLAEIKTSIVRMTGALSGLKPVA